MSDSVDLKRLPSWARKVVEKREAESALPMSFVEKPIVDRRAQPAWPLFVDAATVATFLPRELGPPGLSGNQRKNAEKAVLRFAELKQDPEGTRWSLTREARRAILTASEPDDIADAVNRHTGDVGDPLTVALRECLQGKRTTDFEAFDVKDLETTRLATIWLSGLSHVTLPSIEELDRHIELRRLLEPFERMIGKVQAGTGGSSREDRFFGRAEEIEDLRAYVGVVAADSFGKNVARAAKSVARVFTGRRPKTVWGTGGVGKTTLLAKFMLEHARAAASRFPFAYLDLDRSTISARNRPGLLAEMCRQVGAQFAELTQPMASLRKSLAEQSLQIGASPDADSISLLMPYATQFRQQIDMVFDSSRPFLLVFDTFEIVQYGPDQVIALEELIRSFTGPGDDVWPRFRLIISGRQKVEHFLGDVEELELGALDLKGSAEMLMVLAADAGKRINDTDAERLVAAIGKAIGDKSNTGVRPLRLRLVGELFKQNRETGPEVVKSLLRELSKPVSEQKMVGRLFIDGLLVRRILGHVSDPRVRALADPGLVVRRITQEVIRDVMTLGTERPDGTDRVLPDLDEIEPWIVDDSEAASIFEAFGHEVSLVDRDGDALRHRQDVRQEMLPLIEARRPRGFVRIHRLAFDHFREKAAAQEDDYASAAEAVYHGLWLKKPIAEIEILWPRSSSFDARIDPSEFETGSVPNIYVRAKKKDRLTSDEIRLLPREVTVDWLAARTDELLEQRRLVDEIPLIRAVGGDDYAAFDDRADVAAAVARLLYRAGLWREAALLLKRHVRPEMSMLDEAAVSLLRTLATVAAKSSATPPLSDLDWIVRLAAAIGDPLVRTEVLAYAAVARPRTEARHPSAEILQVVSDVRSSLWRREMRILRLAIASDSYGVELLDVYVNLCDRLFRDRTVAEIVTRMRSKRTTLNDLDSVWKEEKLGFMSAAKERPQVARDLRALAAADHSDWLLPFGNALSRGFDNYGDEIGDAADMIVPKPSRSQLKRVMNSLDGHSLLQLIVAEGGLLDFAEKLARADPETPKALYPETAPEIAAALVHWHQLIVPGSQEDVANDS